ncbi:MAG TPA: class I SAM-dependent methyltransferase [Tepidiformaceae bacterium]|nr:class I SAM-dependent methyltransferase [Tepidiformaceae bacterium]
MSAIARHDEMVRAYHEQQAQLVAAPGKDRWTGALAARFRDNPRRPLDPVLEAIVADLHADDVLIDVGGGAGRLALPLALRCREVIVVDPSEGMQQQFEAVRAEAQIENARYVRADWLAAPGLEGDVVLASHVTFFVPDIAGFIGRMAAAARRRVTLVVSSQPPPNSTRDLFELVHGVPQAPVPGYAELLPALWEMGFLPEVRILPTFAGGTQSVLRTRQEATEWLATNPVSVGAPPERLRALVESNFDKLFVPQDGGWARATTANSRAVLITWETS